MMYDESLERAIISAMEHDEQSKAIYKSLLEEKHFQTKHKSDFVNLLQGKKVDADIRDMVIQNHEFYAQTLKDMYVRKNIHAMCLTIADKIQREDAFDEAIADIQGLQNATAANDSHRGLTITEIEARQDVLKSFEKLETDFDFLDFYDYCGNHKGQTEVIFGHTKHGKTAYAIYRAAGFLKAGYKGLYITMEDTHTKIKDKFTAQLGDGDYKDRIWVSDRSIGTKDLDDVCKFMRYHKVVDDIDFCVIDYVQRIPVKGLSSRDETMKVHEASNRITDLANELDLMVMLLAQPHRIEKIRKGYNMFPEVYDLHGSSAIEKDAFVATSVFRPNQLEELCIYDSYGEIKNIKAPDGSTPMHKNTVYVRQKLNREGERSGRWLQLIHTDNGLTEPTYFTGY